MTAKAKKSALGKGLGALIPDVDNEINADEGKGILEVDINKVSPNEFQPRKNFDEEKLQELAKSIKENGIIQPIIVNKSGKFYNIIAGERRWRAARIAGLKTVPVIEKNLSEKEIMEISLIENLQREDLNPIEEAQAYKRLIEEFSLTQEEISIRIGKSRPVITNSLRLLKLDERVIQYLIEGTISEGHGRVIAGVESFEVQYEIAKRIIDDGLNVRQTEKLVKNINENKSKKVEKKKTDIYIKEIEDKLKIVLGTKVTINSGNKKSKIEIEYYSKEDLERILDIFNV